MPSFKNFSAWHKTHGDLSEETVDLLFQAIFFSPRRTLIRPTEIVDYKVIPTISVANSLLHSLANSAVIKPITAICPVCSSDIDFTSSTDYRRTECPNCGSIVDISSQVIYSTPQTLSEQNLVVLDNYSRDKLLLQNFCTTWDHQGHAYYVLVDLVGSEDLQNKEPNGDELYREFLAALRDIWRREVEFDWMAPHFFLGEIGDLYKMLFSRFEDYLQIAKRLSIAVHNNSVINAFRKESGNTKFPRFKLIVDKVKLPSPQYRSSQLFSATLNGPFDISTQKITQIYRMEGALKDWKPAYYDQDFDIAGWVFSDAITDLRSQGAILPAPTPLKNYGLGNLLLIRDGEIRWMKLPDGPP